MMFSLQVKCRKMRFAFSKFVVAAMLLVCISPQLFSQNYFQKNLAPLPPEPDRNETAHCIITTADGGYTMVGSASLPPALPRIHITKTDVNGNVLWSKKITNDYGYEARSIAETPNGDYIIAGWKNDGVTDKAVFIKTDNDGDLQWTETLQASSHGMAVALTNDPARPYVMVGNDYTVGGGYEPSLPFIAWFDNNGFVASSRINIRQPYATDLNAIKVNSVVQTSDGQYAIAGYLYDQFLTSSTEHAVVLKVSSTGWFIDYCVFYPQNMMARAKGIRKTSDGNLILTGEAFNATNYGGLEIDVIAAKIRNSDFTLLWNNRIGKAGISTSQESRESGFSICQTNDDNDGLKDDGYIIGGYVNRNPTIKGLLIKLTASGTYSYTKILQTNGFTELYSVGQDIANNYIACGYTIEGPTRDYYFLRHSRDEQNGCWNQEKTPSYTTPFAISEAYEFYKEVLAPFVHKNEINTPLELTAKRMVCCVSLNDPSQWMTGTATTKGYGGLELLSSPGAYVGVGSDFQIGQGNNIVIDQVGIAPNGKRIFSGTSSSSSDHENAYSVAEVYGVPSVANGLVIAGSMYKIGTGSFAPDALLVKIDPAFSSILWAYRYGDAASDELHSVKVISNGDIAACGSSSSFNVGNGRELYMIKTNSSGSLLNAVVYGGLNDEYGYTIETTDNNGDGIRGDGYIAVGTTQSYGSGGQDILVVKTHSNLTLDWAKAYGTASNQQGYSIQQTDDDGDSKRDDGYIIAAAEGTSVRLLKITASGSISWTSTYSVNLKSLPAVAQAHDGGFIVTGSDNKTLLLKTDRDGEVMWMKRYPVTNVSGTGTSTGQYVQPTIDGGYLTVGYSSSLISDPANFMHIVKTRCDGFVCDAQDVIVFATPGTITATDITSSIGSASAISTRPTPSLTMDSEFYTLAHCTISALYKQSSSDTIEQNMEVEAAPALELTDRIRAYPHPVPAGSELTIDFTSDNQSSYQISITNLIGQTVYTGAGTANQGSNKLSVNTSALPSGTYQLKIISGTEVMQSLIIIK